MTQTLPGIRWLMNIINSKGELNVKDLTPAQQKQLLKLTVGALEALQSEIDQLKLRIMILEGKNGNQAS